MRSSFAWVVVLFGRYAPLAAALLAACSGGRQDPLAGDCVTDRQCASGNLCIVGQCSDGNLATGRIAGAPADVKLETRGDDEACEDRGDKGVACVLGSSDGLTLIAPTVEGYRFTNWSGGTGCSGEDAELKLSKLKKNVTCVANYVKRVRISGEIEGEGGAGILASAEGEHVDCEPGGCEVDAGTEVVLLAPARDGFRIEGFEGPGCGEREGYRVRASSDQDDVVCTARYVTSLTARGQTSGLPLRADQGQEEVVASSPSPNALCEGPLCAIDPGQSVVLTAPEVEGFRFRGWTGDPACLGSEPVLTLEDITSNIACTADYVARFKVEGVSEGADAPISAQADNVFASCEGAACIVDSGESATLIAGTVDGFRLDHWSGEGCEPLPGASAVAREVSSDVTCTAHYVAGVSVSGTLVNAAGEVEATSDSAGADCALGACAIDVGGTVTLSAPELAGRTFLGWSGSPGCEGTALSITLRDVQTSRACVATYAARYTIGSAANPRTGGTVTIGSRDANARCTAARCEVDEGSTVTISATTAARHRFTGWSGGGPCLAIGQELVISPVNGSVTCTANFVPRIEVSGTVSPAGAGTVTASQLSFSAACSGNACTVDAGSDVSLAATANDGYRFVSWSGCGGPFNPLLGFANLPVLGATEDTVCIANFEKVTYAVAALGSEGGGASASYGALPCPGSVCQVPFGEGATLTALPSEGYDFAGWTGGCSGGAITSVSNVRAPVSCTATFSVRRVSQRGVSASNSFLPAPAPIMSGGSCFGDTCTVDWNGAVTMTAVTTLPEFRFDGWDACAGGSTSGGAGEVMTVTNLRGNQTCTARYTRRVLVSVSADPAVYGTAVCEGSCWVDPGAPVRIRVDIAPNRTLYYWACGAEGLPPSGTPYTSPQYANPRELRPTADISCTAFLVDIVW